MKLKVEPATTADLKTTRKFYRPETGNLISPPLAANLPSDLEGMKELAAVSSQQQMNILETDPTARILKVVDTDKDDEIVSFGRWNQYSSGYLQTIARGKQRGGDDELPTWPETLNKELFLDIVNGIMASRKEWIGTSPCWVLNIVVTRQPMRRNGAGSLIVEWGLQQARKEGVPAYLEASVEAKSLYEKHGFREIGQLEFDGTPHGVPGLKIVLSIMRADP